MLARFNSMVARTQARVERIAECSSLRLVFNSGDEDRLNKDLKLLRDRKKDAKAMRKFLSVPAALETPSLVTGRRLEQMLHYGGGGRAFDA
jgi:hypothetical protein